MSKQLVLVTGATGHLGFRTLILTLQAGYRARIALRKLEQAEKLKKTASIQPYLDSIEFVQVPDITAADAYNEAIKGVDLVLHVASPIYSNLDPNDKDWYKLLYDPAKKGTLSMLTAASKEPKVKRVVVTSSVVVIEPKNGSSRPGPYDVKDVPSDEELKGYPVAPMAYVASKVLAHRAGTEFMEKNKPQFDLIRVEPGYIQGANELYTSAEQMRDEGALGSNEGTMFTALGVTVGRQRITVQVFLDDVAKAHVLALKPEVAKNGDNLLIIGSGGDNTAWQDVVPVIKEQFPDAVAKGIINPKAEDPSGVGHFDVSSSEKALGFKFAGVDEMVKSVVGQYVSFF
jgi:nucleoside-diphosphate-sugar epimerase